MRIPGLHSIHWKVFVFHMAILILPLGYMAVQVRRSIETSYLHSTEEGMIDSAAVVAELYARLAKQPGMTPEKLSRELADVYQNLHATYQIKARLFGFTRAEVDTRLIAYDRTGKVIFDTLGQITRDDASTTSDVTLALKGRYGSRWELDREKQRVNIYSTLPVFSGPEIIGAVSVSKSTNRIRNFVARSLKRLLLPAFIAVVIATAMAYALSAYITRIIWDLAHRAERIAAGEGNVKLETWTRSELGLLARAVEKMRTRLEGKAYVEEMAANLSHELKTPLASIRGAAELLDQGASDDPVARAKFLSNIQSEVARLDRIVSELLKLSRIETHSADLAAAPSDIAPAIQEISRLYQERARSNGLMLNTRLPEGSIEVSISHHQLNQLLTCVLDNAIQFTPEGKEISLVVEKTEEWAVITVSDQGDGIEPELLPKIFDRFFTTPNPRTGSRGTGLGLAIAKSIVELNRGAITASSKPGSGTAVVIRLPSH